jgi:mRNA interferase RelE/StbE
LAFNIRYKASVTKDLKKLDPKDTSKLLGKIEQKLGSGGEKGYPLKGNFSGLFSLRLGDYRIIYTKIENSFLVLRISHRREVYRKRG